MIFQCHSSYIASSVNLCMHGVLLQQGPERDPRLPVSRCYRPLFSFIYRDGKKKSGWQRNTTRLNRRPRTSGPQTSLSVRNPHHDTAVYWHYKRIVNWLNKIHHILKSACMHPYREINAPLGIIISCTSYRLSMEARAASRGNEPNS